MISTSFFFVERCEGFLFSQPEKGNCLGLAGFKICAAIKYRQQTTTGIVW